MEILRNVRIQENLKEIGTTNISPVQDSLRTIENSSLENLKSQNEIALAEDMNSKNNEIKSLNSESKQWIKDETGWSNELIDQISSWEECEIYRNDDLQEKNRNLQRNDIDLGQIDSSGRTNRQRMEEGYAPIHKDGTSIELHHIGQKMDGSLVELTQDKHRRYDSILHPDKQEKSQINRSVFANERKEYWRNRAKEGV